MNAKDLSIGSFLKENPFHQYVHARGYCVAPWETKESTRSEKLLFALCSVQKSDLNNLSQPTVVSCLSTCGLTLNN